MVSYQHQHELYLYAPPLPKPLEIVLPTKIFPMCAIAQVPAHGDNMSDLSSRSQVHVLDQHFVRSERFLCVEGARSRHSQRQHLNYPKAEQLRG